jgi:hypothetical protein
MEPGSERSIAISKKRPGPEQIVTLLRQIEIATLQGKTISIASRWDIGHPRPIASTLESEHSEISCYRVCYPIPNVIVIYSVLERCS